MLFVVFTGFDLYRSDVSSVLDDEINFSQAFGVVVTQCKTVGMGWGAKFGPEGSSIIGSPSGNPE